MTQESHVSVGWSYFQAGRGLEIFALICGRWAKGRFLLLF